MCVPAVLACDILSTLITLYYYVATTLFLDRHALSAMQLSFTRREADILIVHGL